MLLSLFCPLNLSCYLWISYLFAILKPLFNSLSLLLKSKIFHLFIYFCMFIVRTTDFTLFATQNLEAKKFEVSQLALCRTPPHPQKQEFQVAFQPPVFHATCFLKPKPQEHEVKGSTFWWDVARLCHSGWETLSAGQDRGSQQNTFAYISLFSSSETEVSWC